MEKAVNGAITDQRGEYVTAAPSEVPMGRSARRILELFALAAGAREAENAARAVRVGYEERLRDLSQAKLDEHAISHTGPVEFDFERSVLVLKSG